MLWTTIESLHEKLPFKDYETGLIITADARIDNRKFLSETLNIGDKKEVSDSYFIIKSYEKWGEKCPEYLLGDFSFAIWDLNKNKLFCSRDHMGVKPFYYYLSDDLFIFSTEIKALFCFPGVKNEINELQIANSLIQLYDDKEITFYKNIKRLPSANSLTINMEDYNLNQYWDLDPYNEIHLNSQEEYINVFKDVFKETVRCRLRSAFPVASMLSGGLDSSSVSCIAQRILKTEYDSDLNTFSAIFESVPESNERNFIENVLNTDSFNSHYINVDKINPLDEIDKVLFYGENPAIAPNTFMSWNIYKEASKIGSKVLLDGLEGDMTVSHGDGFFEELGRNKRWNKLFHEVNCFSERLEINPYKIIFQISLSTLIPKFLKRKVNSNREFNQNYGSRSRIIRKEFAESIGSFDKIFEAYEDKS